MVTEQVTPTPEPNYYPISIIVYRRLLYCLSSSDIMFIVVCYIVYRRLLYC